MPLLSSVTPTAQASSSETTETLLKKLLIAPAGFGLGTIFHLEPFQRSISVCVLPPWAPKPPTAQASSPETAATPSKTLNCAPVGFGLGTTFHVEPFQCSINDWELTPLRNSPTAQTSSSELAVAPRRMLEAAPLTAARLGKKATSATITQLPMSILRRCFMISPSRFESFDVKTDVYSDRLYDYTKVSCQLIVIFYILLRNHTGSYFLTAT